MSNTCKDVPGSAVQSVMLLIRLGEATVANREELARQVLSSEKVRKAIHEAFRDQAGKMASASLTGTSMGADTATALLKPIGKAAAPAAEKAVKSQEEYKKLERGLKELKCAWDASPVGVFVDKNQTWLIIVGALAAVGGAAVMYKTKTGDLPAKGMALLTEKIVKREIGSVTLDAKGMTFVPSKREIGGTLGIEIKSAEAVKTRFEVKSVVEGKTLKELTFTESFVVPVDEHTKFKASAGVGTKDDKALYNVALGVTHSRNGLDLSVAAYMKGLGNEQTYGSKAGVGYGTGTDRIFGKGSRLSVGASAGVEATRAAGGNVQTAAVVSGNVTLTFF